MRILKVIPYFYPELKFGGPPLKVRSLACEIATRDYEVTVVTFDSEQPSPSPVSPAAIAVNAKVDN